MGEHWPTVMVTGHRHLPDWQQSWVRRKLREAVAWLREECGTTDAVSGLALGVDTWFAREALRAGLNLHAFIPFPQQPCPWPQLDRDEWARLRAAAAHVTVVGDLAQVSPLRRRAEAVRLLHARNDRMLAASTAVVAVLGASVTKGGTRSTFDKALARGLPVVHLEPETRTVAVRRPDQTQGELPL